MRCSVVFLAHRILMICSGEKSAAGIGSFLTTSLRLCVLSIRTSRVELDFDLALFLLQRVSARCTKLSMIVGSSPSLCLPRRV
jgi:hypothetical protein